MPVLHQSMQISQDHLSSSLHVLAKYKDKVAVSDSSQNNRALCKFILNLTDLKDVYQSTKKLIKDNVRFYTH